MTAFQKQMILRFLFGGVLFAGATSLLFCFWNGNLYPIPSVLIEARESLFGSLAMAIAFQTLLLFLLGGLLGVATLPFDATGHKLMLQSLGHFLLTGAAVALTAWDCMGADAWNLVTLYLSLYAFLYLTVWITRYLGWRREVSLLRRALTLPEPPPSPLYWRESLPYLILLAALFLLLRPFVEGIDRYNGFDVIPVVRGFLLPYIVYPWIALLLGYAVGRHVGKTPLVAVTVFVSFLPNLLYSSIRYRVWEAVLYVCLALLAQTAGWLTRAKQEGKEER